MDITKNAEKAPVLKTLPSRLLGQTAALVGRVAGDALADAGSHRYAFAVLATLDAFGPLSQAELCRRTDLDRSDMNGTVNALEAEGSVTRRPDPADRRQNIVALTEAGRTRFDDLERRLSAAQDKALAPLSGDERALLVQFLQRLHDHLSPG